MTLKKFFDDALAELKSFKGFQATRNGQQELKHKWNEDPHTFAQDSDHFYEHEVGDSYLYDLATWHSSGTIYNWGQLVYQYAYGSVWDFGGGIGTYSLLAAASPLVTTVYYDDINLENQEFAKWRFSKHGLLDKIKFGPPEEQVKSIICLDVIEHLSDPYKHLARFNTVTNSGAIMVVNITAHNSNGEHPMHIMNRAGENRFWEELAKTWSRFVSSSPSVWRKI